MIKIKIKGNNCSITVDGNAKEIVAEFIYIISRLYMIFESQKTSSGRAMLKCIESAINSGTIEDAVAEMQRQSQ